jgi:hypothetical protein
MSVTARSTLLTAAKLLAGGLLLAVTFGPNLTAHVKLAVNPTVFNDDVRQQIYPLFRFTESTIARDVSDDYQIALMPLGFRLLYRSLAPVVDPEPLSKILPYALLVAMLFALAIAAKHLGGTIAAFMSLALALQTSAFLDRIVGGMPRSFAFVFVAWGLCALISGRARVLAVLVVVAQAFYSVAAALLGLMLGALLFLVPQADRGDTAGWTWRRRLALLIFVGAAMGTLAAPVSIAMGRWGRLLGPGDAMRYPEIGPGGRFERPDMIALNRISFPDFRVETRRQVDLTLQGNSRSTPLIPPLRNAVRGRETIVTNVLLVTLGIGLVALASQGGATRRALVLPLAGIAGYVFATVLSPYLLVPQRYIAYTLPLAIVVFLPAGAAALAGAIGSRFASWPRAAGALIAAAASLALLGGRGDPAAGYVLAVNPDIKVYDFMRSLPNDALIAGWPAGVIENVPYVSRRRAFLTRENHMVFHEGYVLEMRRRMNAVVAALFSSDASRLLELRDTFHVTHLIVEAEYFSQPPQYFIPFDVDVARVWQEGRERGFAVEEASANAVVFNEGHITVLDLSKL